MAKPTVTTYEFSVPDWLSVAEHPGEAKRWPADTPPRLYGPAKEAAQRRRLLCAWSEYEGERFPYGFASLGGIYYVYPAEVDPSMVFGSLGKPLEAWFLFDEKPPNEVTGTHAYRPHENHNPEHWIYLMPNDEYVLAFGLMGTMNLISLGKIGDAVESIAIRLTVMFNILEGMKLGRTNPYLPYGKDTPAIAMQRLIHAKNWQLKKSRTRPMFA